MIENMVGDTIKDDLRNKLGMDVFLSQHKGFFGRIKTRPEDFRVTEIGLSGKLVQLEGGEEMLTSSNDGLITPQLHDEAKKVRTEQKSRDSVDDLSVGNSENTSTCTLPPMGDMLTFDDSTDPDQLIPILQGRIGEQVMDGLRAFSEQEVSRNEPSPNTSAAPTCSHLSPSNLKNSASKGDDFELRNCFSLGEIAVKDERALVHKAVQCLYPHLKTSAVKLACSHSVKVSTNPTFWDFRKLLTNREADKMIRFASSNFSSRTVSIDDEGADSKEKRTAIHRLVSKHFGKFLETKTCLVGDGKQEVVVRFRERYVQKDGRGVKRKVVETEGDGPGPVYTGFTLKKRNLETLDALKQLARALRIQPSDFSYAGMKDKKAVTLQSVAVKGVGQNRFKQMLNDANLPGITVDNIRPLASVIHVGDLTGNRFDILVRDVHLHDDGNENPNPKDVEEGALLWQEMDRCFESVKERGFVNYFGEQRFGMTCDGGSQSAAVGKSILAGKYKEAVRQILSPDGDKDDPVNRAKRHFQQTQNPKEALVLMPRHKSRECLVLKALHRHGLDRDGCTRALFCIPHAMRQFYVHAFCSLVWNHMASERLRSYGYEVVAGDLVQIGDERRGTRDKIHVVTEADTQASTFSFRDVVLPLPGNNIRYPSNRVGDVYSKYLEEAGLGSCTYRVTELQMNIPGDYRRLIEWPKDHRWDLELLCGDDDDVVMTKPEVKGSADCHLKPQEDSQCCRDGGGKLAMPRGSLKDCKDLSKTDARNHNHCSENSENVHNSLTKTEKCSPGLDKRQVEGKFIAKGANLRVKFSLPPSTYATIFLRELMKR